MMLNKKSISIAAKKRHRVTLLRGAILGVCVASGTMVHGQQTYPIEIPLPTVLSSEGVPTSLPDHVLNCPICRERLGLPPINTPSASPATVVAPSVPNANSLPLLPPSVTTNSASPLGASVPSSAPQGQVVPTTSKDVPTESGTVRSLTPIATAAIGQAAAHARANPGQLVNENPSQPSTGAATPQVGSTPASPPRTLEGIPLEVRQRVMRELELPPGARVLSIGVASPEATASGTKDPIQESVKQKDGQGVVNLVPSDSIQPGTKSEQVSPPTNKPAIASQLDSVIPGQLPIAPRKSDDLQPRETDVQRNVPSTLPQPQSNTLPQSKTLPPVKSEEPVEAGSLGTRRTSPPTTNPPVTNPSQPVILPSSDTKGLEKLLEAQNASIEAILKNGQRQVELLEAMEKKLESQPRTQNDAAEISELRDLLAKKSKEIDEQRNNMEKAEINSKKARDELENARKELNERMKVFEAKEIELEARHKTIQQERLQASDREKAALDTLRQTETRTAQSIEQANARIRELEREEARRKNLESEVKDLRAKIAQAEDRANSADKKTEMRRKEMEDTRQRNKALEKDKAEQLKRKLEEEKKRRAKEAEQEQKSPKKSPSAGGVIPLE